jgi:hypothetical protein
MAINVERRVHRDGRVTFFDNGIRVHGSVDYQSLLGKYSHGCHRLYNNLALRMFSFVLKHRQHKVMGPAVINFRRTFYRDEKVFDLRLPVRGFYYELDPPLPIEVLEGNVLGKLEDPIEEYVPIPGVEYPVGGAPSASGGVESKSGGGAASDDGDDLAGDDV